MHRIWNTILVLGVRLLDPGLQPPRGTSAAAVNVSTIVAATLQAMTPAVPPSPAASAGLPVTYGNVSLAFEMNELQIYFDAVTEKLNATTSEKFTPSLATLDALVQSISAK